MASSASKKKTARDATQRQNPFVVLDGDYPFRAVKQSSNNNHPSTISPHFGHILNPCKNPTTLMDQSDKSPLNT